MVMSPVRRRLQRQTAQPARSLEPSESAASACTAVGVSRNQGDDVFYDGLAIASDRAASATAKDAQWFPLAQSLTNLTAIPRPTPTATQAERDIHYSAYLAVVIACLPSESSCPQTEPHLKSLIGD